MSTDGGKATKKREIRRPELDWWPQLKGNVVLRPFTIATLLAGVAIAAFAMNQSEPAPSQEAVNFTPLSRTQLEELTGAFGPQPTTKPEYAQQQASPTVKVQAAFPATNVEKGCVALQVAMISRIEQLSDMDAAACRKLKATTENGKPDENRWLGCIFAATVTYNRNHLRFDMDRVPTDISDAMMRGCAMIIFDVSEATYERTRKRM
jgi:hypothetical protein